MRRCRSLHSGGVGTNEPPKFARSDEQRRAETSRDEEGGQSEIYSNSRAWSALLAARHLECVNSLAQVVGRYRDDVGAGVLVNVVARVGFDIALEFLKARQGNTKIRMQHGGLLPWRHAIEITEHSRQSEASYCRP